ncbi:uncharacterized protein areg isoform X2 [Brachyhypopomus gauderio]|uniref:uncharacterized protein areg isoform X2 n=1 Tax=Brachyhypopomus gauderio TaxID=698409 RepID=UPI004041E812
MHLILSCSLLCTACSVVISSASFVTYSSELGHVTVMSASGEGLQSAAGAEQESDNNANTSGAPADMTILTGTQANTQVSDLSEVIGQPGRKSESHSGNTRRKHGSKKRPRNQATVAQQTRTHTHTHSPTSNPCLSSHKDYCIHGHCTYLQDLEEPVCVCMKGYDGIRCGVHLLQTGSGSEGLDKPSSTDSLHVTLIIIAAILSLISCSAILLMIYRTLRSFQTAFFSSAHGSTKPLKTPVV